MVGPFLWMTGPALENPLVADTHSTSPHLPLAILPSKSEATGCGSMAVTGTLECPSNHEAHIGADSSVRRFRTYNWKLQS